MLASKFSDCDPYTPWRVGFVCQVVETWKPHKFEYIVGYSDGTWKDKQLYTYCRRIAEDEGAEWLSLYRQTP